MTTILVSCCWNCSLIFWGTWHYKELVYSLAYYSASQEYLPPMLQQSEHTRICWRWWVLCVGYDWWSYAHVSSYYYYWIWCPTYWNSLLALFYNVSVIFWINYFIISCCHPTISNTIWGIYTTVIYNQIVASFLGSRHQREDVVQPAILAHYFSYWNSKLCFLTPLHHFYHQHIILDFESSPQLLHAPCAEIHCMLLVEFLVWEQPIFIDHYETFLPFTEKLRLFKYFSVNIAVVCNRLRSPDYFFFLRFPQFHTFLP